MPKLRLQFPFLWEDRVEGRAKRSVRDQPLPLLLSSYRAHLRSITTLAYIDERKLVLRSPQFLYFFLNQLMKSTEILFSLITVFGANNIRFRY